MRLVVVTVVCMTTVWEIIGVNATTGTCVYHDSKCDTQPRHGMCTLTAVPRLTQLSIHHELLG